MRTNVGANKPTAHTGYRRIYESYNTEYPEIINADPDIKSRYFLDDMKFGYQGIDVANNRDFYKNWTVPVLSLLPFLLALRTGGGQNAMESGQTRQ